MELFHESSGSHDQSIIKGKRTKRTRQTSSGHGSKFLDLEPLRSSPTNSNEISTSTEEDEDMANCLILLARGGSSPPCSSTKNKHISRKFAEMEGKIGMFVYECKTCNRTFPSFQALGGHRASHKRLKQGNDESERKKLPMVDFPMMNNTVLSTNLPNRFLVGESKSKVHECAICGAEFGSGQALGGHMRRHRSIVPVINNNIVRSGSSIDNDIVRSGTSIDNDTSDLNAFEKSRNVLGLDLNLPAESEDDQWQERFHRFSSFSAAPPLVGCHY